MKAADAAISLSRGQLAALIAVLLMAFTEALTVAFNIGAIMTRFAASGAQAGSVATAHGLSVAVAALVGTRLIGRFSARRLVAVGLALVATGNLLAQLATGVAMMAACMAIAGFGTGLVVCVVTATAARTKKPEMTYGLINASVGAYLSVLALVVPRLLVSGGFEAIYGLYAALALLGLLCLPWVPDVRAPSAPDAAQSPAAGAGSAGRIGNRAGWIGLFGMGLFYLSIAGMGAFVERIGVSAGIAVQTIGLAYFVGGLLTIVGPIAAGMVGARFGSTRPLLLLGALMCVAAWGLALEGSAPVYLASIPIWIVLPAMLTPSFLGGLAVIDPTGRRAGAQPAFASIGGSMGAVSAGAVADAGGFGSLGLFVIVMLIVALSLMASATLRADAIRSAGRLKGDVPEPVSGL